MRAFSAFAVLLLIATCSLAQQTPNGVENYSPYSIALLPNVPGADVILPFFTSENKVAFFKLSEVQQASKEKRLLGRPITYGELIALIGDLQIQVTQLKQENEKLWAVAGKTSAPATVILQSPPPPVQSAPAQNPTTGKNDALMKYMLLRQLFPSAQPYQLPMPNAPNNGLNCTTTHIGSTAYTNCR